MDLLVMLMTMMVDLLVVFVTMMMLMMMDLVVLVSMVMMNHLVVLMAMMMLVVVMDHLVILVFVGYHLSVMNRVNLLMVDWLHLMEMDCALNMRLIRLSLYKVEFLFLFKDLVFNWMLPFEHSEFPPSMINLLDYAPFVEPQLFKDFLVVNTFLVPLLASTLAWLYLEFTFLTFFDIFIIW